MFGLYLIGLLAYIPATPVSGYMTLTLKRLGFSTFDSNMLTIPAAVLQIITMLVLAKSSDHFNERTFHAFFGELWIMPLLISLIALPDGGRNYPRFALTTLVRYVLPCRSEPPTNSINPPPPFFFFDIYIKLTCRNQFF